MTRATEGAHRGRLRDALADIGVVPASSRFFCPPVGLVSRLDLVRRIVARPPDVVTITAPAGYGKSTFAAELLAADDRPGAWITLTEADDDPAVLLTDVALALDPIEPVDPEVVGRLWRGAPSTGSPAIQLFGATVAERQRPFTLVLDDAHHVVRPEAVDALSTLVTAMPPGATVVLTSRTAAPLPLGRLRARRRLVELGPAELAFGAREATHLFDALDLPLAPADVARLVERTEGWPVAMYLAALAREVRGPDVVDDFAGDHRYLVDYLSDELLGAIDADVAGFLMDASCLGTLSGEMCDQVLGREGSGQLLEDLHRRLLLVIALDDHRESYRFHHLLDEFLQSELVRRDPSRRAAIHRRASEWWDRHGDPEGAVRHAALSGDYDLTEAMVLRWWGTAAASAARPNTDRWILLFPPAELERRPLLMVDAAWARFACGDAGAALRWLSRASEILADRARDEAHGLVAPVALAAARSIIAPLSPAAMAVEATYVHEHVGHGEGHPISCLALGAAAFMTGDVVAATKLLSDGADTPLDRPLVVANCLAHLAVINAEHGRWTDAAAQATRARRLTGTAATVAHSALVLAAHVLVAAREGRSRAVEQDRRMCRQHLVDLAGSAPWLALQAHLALGRAAVLRGDRAEATAAAGDAAAILRTVDGADHVATQLATLHRDIAGLDAGATCVPASLTAAELRVLQLLPTHLTIPEIAERLYVSRNTVKSQTIAIYRKLGTSSRSGAVRAAAAAGLLDATAGRSAS